MTGMVAATVGVGLAAAAASAYSASKQSEQAGAAAGVAGQNAAMQNYLTQKQMDRQDELGTATQVDADGNRLIYDPNTRSWIPLLSERGLQTQAAGRAAEDIERERYFGRGQWEDQQAFQRRFAAGGEARKLLAAMRDQSGAPTREGVEGANRLYGATAASEPADLIKSGAATAQLRTGTGASGLKRNLDAVNRSGVQGIRTALAKPQTGVFDEAFASWRDPQQAAYNAFASSAAPPGQAPPGTGTEALSAQVAARAAKGYTPNPYAGYGSNLATKSLLDAMKEQKQFDWGAAITGVGKLGLEAWEKKISANKPPVGQGGAIVKTGSTQSYF